MNKKIFLLAFIIIEMLVMPYNYGQKQSGTVQNPYVVPTYECAGLYWKVKEVGSPPLQFGRRAYMNYNEGRAPWEMY